MQHSEPDADNNNDNTTLQTLDARIRVILQSTPLHQLGTITTRDVRARLLQDGAIDEAWVKKNKKALHALIAGVFEQVSAPLVVPASDSRPNENGYENGAGIGRAKEEEGGGGEEEYAASAYNGGANESEFEYANGNGNGNGYGYSETYSEREGTESQYADDNGTYGDEADGDGASSSSRPFPPTQQQHQSKSKSEKQTKQKKLKAKRALTDEEYARRLSSEINGRPRSSRLGKTPTPRSKSRPKVKPGASQSRSSTLKRNKKSAEQVLDSESGEEDREEYGDEDEDGGVAAEAEYDSESEGRRLRSSRRDRDPKPPPKKKRKSRGNDEAPGGSKGGFKKEYILSVPLSTLLSTTRLSRPQVVKQLWDYIKSNNLQNPHNRREILCDDLLRPVFNADKIDMFKMNKVLGGHLHEIETE